MVPRAVGGQVSQALLQHHFQLKVGQAGQPLALVQPAKQSRGKGHHQRAAQ